MKSAILIEKAFVARKALRQTLTPAKGPTKKNVYAVQPQENSTLPTRPPCNYCGIDNYFEDKCFKK